MEAEGAAGRARGRARQRPRNSIERPAKAMGGRRNEKVDTVGRGGAPARGGCRRWRTTRCSRRRATRRSGRCRPATTPTPATPTLDQINKDNVGDLQVAWTFSTGVLRGHEGSPLVIGDMMYVHTPFPNTVFALDLAQDGKIVWKYSPAAGSERHRRDVLRHRLSRPRLCRRHDLPAPGRHHAGRARRQDRRGEVERQERRSGQGRDQHRHRAAGEGQGHRRHLGRRVRRARSRHRLQHRRRLAGLARLLDRAGRRDAGRPGEDHRRSASRSARTARSTAGKATSGRSAAAPPGAGTATIPSSTSSTTAPATPRPGTRRSGPATTSTR